MMVKELMELLEEESPDAEVRLVFQQSFPHVYSVLGVASDLEVAEVEGGDCQEPCNARPAKDVVYLVEGDWLAHGPSAAWVAARSS